MKCRECEVVLPPEARFCLSCGARVEPELTDSALDPVLEALKKSIGFQYRIERLLGRGGMGAVYLAHEIALDRDVAIKVLPPEQAGASHLQERFRREARIAARLSHPNIVQLHTFAEVSGLMYFVMAYVPGESLASRLKRQGAFHPDEASRLLVALCDALDYAHRQGIVHRDIKPDNILIDEASGAPLLMDFGIAKPGFAEGQLTMTGQLVGTPHYMSPEQALGEGDVDARSDLYSLGLVAYEMITGRRPFTAEGPLDTLTQRIHGDPKPVTSAEFEIPPELALAVDRCLKREVTKRWPDAKSLREALQPSDEESEESLPARLLRTSVMVAFFSVLAHGYLSLYSALNPDFRLPLGGFGLLVAAVAPMAIIAAGACIVLRSAGLDGRSLLMKAFQQPLWWRSWYPRFLRRHGDVWSRLPHELRRFRLYRGFLQVYMLGIVLPMQVMTEVGRHLPVAQGLLWVTGFALMAWVLTERRRATRFVHSKVSMTATEASAILTAPTWRVSTWRRAPASSLLYRQGHRRGSQMHEPDETATVADVTRPDSTLGAGGAPNRTGVKH